jgi:hypothetical protein
MPTLKIWDGSQWIIPAGGSNGGGISEVPENHPHSVGDAPEDPVLGAIWLDTTETPEPDDFDLIEEKGDLIVGQEAGLVGRLPAGLPGQVLAVDPDSPLGVRWVDPPEGEVVINPFTQTLYLIDVDVAISTWRNIEILLFDYPFA